MKDKSFAVYEQITETANERRETANAKLQTQNSKPKTSLLSPFTQKKATLKWLCDAISTAFLDANRETANEKL